MLCVNASTVPLPLKRSEKSVVSKGKIQPSWSASSPSNQPVTRAPAVAQATATGILPIQACHSFGPVSCTLAPRASTATVTGMSLTSNS